MHAAVFGSTDPDRLITLARAYPGWAGVCYLMAGLLAYSHGGHLRASELLQHGLSLRNDDDANRYASVYLAGVVTRVEVAERIEVPVLFSEEAVFLALSHSLRETGQTEAALAALAGLPPSLPLALARCSLAAELGRDTEVVAETEGLLNADDLSAALLLVRARSLRRLGAYTAARVGPAGGPAAPEDRLHPPQRCPDGPRPAPPGQRPEDPRAAGLAAPETGTAGDREGHPQGRGNARTLGPRIRAARRTTDRLPRPIAVKSAYPLPLRAPVAGGTTEA